MSWMLHEKAYHAFGEVAQQRAEPTQPFVVEVWEQTADSQDDGWKENIFTDPACLGREARSRIIFAPLDLPQRWTSRKFIDLFRVLAIPGAFVEERLQQASHSFGAMEDASGSCAWFHFLCKNVEVADITVTTAKENFVIPAVAYHPDADPSKGFTKVMGPTPSYGSSQSAISPSAISPSATVIDEVAEPLPQGDNSYLRSGFHLRVSPAGVVTLCCFGATENVKSIAKDFLQTFGWSKILAEPYILFDLVMAGLFVDVDENVWNINHIYGALEHRTLVNKKPRRRQRSREFAGMHNIAKHITHLKEAVESCILATDCLLSRLQRPNPDPLSAPSAGELGSPTMRQQLRDSLLHRRSLFRSTKLRLGSLHERVTNSITLSFNLLTTSDSVVMLEHSNAMRILAFITIAFLPTTTVASILGSQLFSSTPDANGGFTVQFTPLFPVTWYVAVPLTVVLALCSWLWGRKTHHENPKKHFELRRQGSI